MAVSDRKVPIHVRNPVPKKKKKEREIGTRTRLPLKSNRYFFYYLRSFSSETETSRSESFYLSRNVKERTVFFSDCFSYSVNNKNKKFIRERID